jgi:hypothetical protein
MSELQFPKEDVARRGDEIYERIRADMESKHYGKIVAIDLDTGFYGVGETYQAAAEPVFAKDAAADIWFIHVGRENMTRFGFGKRFNSA